MSNDSARQAGDQTEIEITPAMIEAGVRALDWNRESHPDFSLVERIYTAMELARIGVPVRP